LELLTGYLDFFEDITLRKISGLTEDQLRTSTVPSGWTPLGMVKHRFHAETPGQRSFRPEGGPPPTLGWVLCHLLEGAARHAGHLDIARELTDGSVGSD
jgi:hypothetical protein